MKVLGVSGSPVPNSNTDRALRAVLDATGVDTEFIKLSDLTVAPCRACLRCVDTNRCVIDDDGVALAGKARKPTRSSWPDTRPTRRWTRERKLSSSASILCATNMDS